jgi:predicted amidohydrolase YtcJ
MDEGSLRDALRNGFRDIFTRHGVTTVGEISETLAGIRCRDDLHAAGEFGLRVRVYLWTPGTVSLDAACRWREELTLRSPESLLRIQGVKMFADGGYSAASAAMNGEYVGRPGWSGAIALSPAQVADALARTREAGLQLAIHANGDRAQEEVCAAIAAAGGAPEGRPAPESSTPGTSSLSRSRRRSGGGVRGSSLCRSPAFLYTFGDFFPVYLGEYGARGRFPFRSLLRDGWRLSGSSDVWVGSEEQATNPLFSVWCGVARRTFRGDTIDEDEAIPVEDALRMHTIDAAAVLGRERLVGSLEPGKVADCVVLDRDPTACATEELLDVQVDAVVVDGRLAYEREGAPPLTVTVV